jgi:hypothetical protein
MSARPGDGNERKPRFHFSGIPFLSRFLFSRRGNEQAASFPIPFPFVSCFPSIGAKRETRFKATKNMKTETPSECMRSLADIADHLYVVPLPSGDTARELWINARALTERVQSLMVNPDSWETLAGFNDIAEQVVDALRELC